MQEHSLSTSRTARYFTLGHPSDARELWFVCHGYGQLASRFLERFRSLESQRRCIVAPEGLSRFYLTEHATERRVGASWMTREDRLHEIDDYVRYLDALHAVVASAEARVTALGFSQGTATVCRWAAYGSARIDRLIVWGGEVPPDLDLGDARVKERLDTLRDGDPRRVHERVAAGRDHIAPRRRGRLYAEPQVRESRLEYDGVPDAEGRGDDHGGKRVRQDVARKNAQPARAHRDGAFDKRPRGERAHFAVDESRDAHPSRDAEDGDDEQRARLPERREQQKVYDPGQG